MFSHTMGDEAPMARGQQLPFYLSTVRLSCRRACVSSSVNAATGQPPRTSTNSKMRAASIHDFIEDHGAVQSLTTTQ